MSRLRLMYILVTLCLSCLPSIAFSAALMIYMDEDFEGQTPFVDQNFPIRDETVTPPTLPQTQGLNIRCTNNDNATTRVQLALNTGTVVTSRAYKGTHCYSLMSSQSLATVPGQIGNRLTQNVRVWQFAISADSASASLTSGTVIGRYKLNYSTDPQQNPAPEVTVVLEVVKNGTGGFSVVCRNNNVRLGTLSGAKTDWLLITLVAAQKVTYVEAADDYIAWGAYDPLTDSHKGPQPIDTDKSVLPAGIHIFADKTPDGDAFYSTVHTRLTRAKELGMGWGYINGNDDNSFSSEVGWQFDGLNGGRIYIDNLYWAAEGHDNWTSNFVRDQAARLEPFARTYSNPLPPTILKAHQPGIYDDDIIYAGNGTRHFRTVVPPSYKAAKPIGILFGFQGMGPPYRSFLIGTRFEDLANYGYYIAVTPANGGRSFDTADTANNPDVLLVHSILNRLRGLYSIDNNRLFCAGFSNGGAFASQLTRYPSIIPLAVSSPCEPVHAQPFAPDARNTIITFGGSTDQYGTLQDVDNQINGSLQHQRDGAFYSFNLPHTFPKADALTNPPLLWAQKCVRYFNTHPLNYQNKAYSPPSYGFSFRDDFNSASTTGSLTTPPWISVLSANTKGHFGDLWGLQFFKRNGRLVTQPIAPNQNSSATICAFAFTDFLRKGFEWETSFRLETVGPDTRVYPCLLRDMKGRMISLTISQSQWDWAVSPDQLSFHADVTNRITRMTSGTINLQTQQDYRVKVLYNPPAVSWQILDIEGKAIASGSLPSGFDYMPDAEAGIGVRALPAEAVSFDYVRANVPSAVEEEQWLRY